jgi:hypothetical protein
VALRRFYACNVNQLSTAKRGLALGQDIGDQLLASPLEDVVKNGATTFAGAHNLLSDLFMI